MPYFRKSEGLTASAEVAIDAVAHSSDGPLGVSVRSPIIPAAQAFVEAAEAAGFKRGDYNGRDRGGVAVTSLFQTTTKKGNVQALIRRFWRANPSNGPISRS